MTGQTESADDLRRVLIVEDDAAVRGLAEAALRDIGGLAVCACGSATEALEAAPGFAPDLFLLDVQLPDMDGPALAQVLRARPGLSDTPIVLLTGRPEAMTGGPGAPAGIVDVLGKPFDPITLADTLRSIWRRAREAAR